MIERISFFIRLGCLRRHTFILELITFVCVTLSKTIVPYSKINVCHLRQPLYRNFGGTRISIRAYMVPQEEAEESVFAPASGGI